MDEQFKDMKHGQKALALKDKKEQLHKLRR